jgi:NAD(P)-dependent dehydrogenase (short-subunit alcohol dehydrogenase family)
MAYNFTGKKAVVTGASRGIGKGIATTLTELGAEVYAVSKTQENLNALKTELPNIHTICVDLGDWAATKTAIEKIGTVDFLVNNAALLPTFGPFLEMTEENLDAMYQVNLKSVVNVSQILARRMIEVDKPGVIVNVSSITAVRSEKGTVGYSTMKAALDMLTKVMALELGPNNIRVVGVRPTAIMTDGLVEQYPGIREYCAEKSPIGKAGEVEDVVNTVVFLLSDKAALIIGSSLDLDAGQLLK